MGTRDYTSIEERLSEKFGIEAHYNEFKNTLTVTSKNLFCADKEAYTLNTALELDGRNEPRISKTLNTKIWSTIQNNVRRMARNNDLFTMNEEGELQAVGYYDI